MQEVHGQQQWGSPLKKNMLPFWFAVLIHSARWSVLLCHFSVGLAHASVPGFACAATVLLFVCELLMLLNLYLEQCEYADWADYLTCELAFCVLSLASTQLMAWLMFAGLLSMHS